MMRFALFGKNAGNRQISGFMNVINILRQKNHEVTIFEPFYKEISTFLEVPKPFSLYSSHEELVDQADMVFSLGGDGTLLGAVELVRDSQIPILGINIGRLGFLSATTVEEFPQALEKITNNEYSLEQRSLLRVSSDENIFGALSYAFNDLTILADYRSRMLSISVWVDDCFVNNYWGDGLIVATPTGSTAYSMSCGGDILTPVSKNFIITPIAPHNLTVRSLILSDNSKICVQVQPPFKNYVIALDSRSFTEDKPIKIYIEKEKFGINLALLHGKDFFQTLRSKLNWGLDKRN